MSYAERMHEQVQVELEQTRSDWQKVEQGTKMEGEGVAMRAAALQRLHIALGGPEYVRQCNQRYGWSQSTAYKYKDPHGLEKDADRARRTRGNSGRPENSEEQPSKPEYSETKTTHTTTETSVVRSEVIKSVGSHLNALAAAIPRMPVETVYGVLEQQIGGISVELLEELDAIVEWVSALRDMVKPNAISCSDMKRRELK